MRATMLAVLYINSLFAPHRDEQQARESMARPRAPVTLAAEIRRVDSHLTALPSTSPWTLTFRTVLRMAKARNEAQALGYVSAVSQAFESCRARPLRAPLVAIAESWVGGTEQLARIGRNSTPDQVEALRDLWEVLATAMRASRSREAGVVVSALESRHPFDGEAAAAKRVSDLLRLQANQTWGRFD